MWLEKIDCLLLNRGHSATPPHYISYHLVCIMYAPPRVTHPPIGLLTSQLRHLLPVAGQDALPLFTLLVEQHLQLLQLRLREAVET